MSATITTIHRLVDGPLHVDIPSERADLVAKMAKVLLRKNTFVNYRAAMQALRPFFEIGDIAVLIEDARQVAMQHVVAMEMSRP